MSDILIGDDTGFDEVVRLLAYQVIAVVTLVSIREVREGCESWSVGFLMQEPCLYLQSPRS